MIVNKNLKESKSPFLIFKNFISPKFCEELVKNIAFEEKHKNQNNFFVRESEYGEKILISKLQEIVIGKIQNHYGVTIKGSEKFKFEKYVEGSMDLHKVENSKKMKDGKFLKVNGRDFTGVLFLKNYREKLPFDYETEVMGGKLEFFQYNFGFNPERGTLVLFPSGINFINVTAPISVGELYQVRMQFLCTIPYFYNPEEFQGNFYSWFIETGIF